MKKGSCRLHISAYNICIAFLNNFSALQSQLIQLFDIQLFEYLFFHVDLSIL